MDLSTVGDAVDPGIVLRDAQRRLISQLEGSLMPTNQRQYEEFEKRFVLGMKPLLSSRRSRFPRQFLYDPQSNHFSVHVDVGYGLPQLVVDNHHRIPVFVFTTSVDRAKVRSQLISTMEHMRVCSLTRYWDIGTPMCMLRYLGQSTDSVSFLEGRISDPRENRGVKGLAASTLNLMTGHFPQVETGRSQ